MVNGQESKSGNHFLDGYLYKPTRVRMPKHGKKTNKVEPGVASAWGCDKRNPYALPWEYKAVAGESHGNKGVSLAMIPALAP